MVSMCKLLETLTGTITIDGVNVQIAQDINRNYHHHEQFTFNPLSENVQGSTLNPKMFKVQLLIQKCSSLNSESKNVRGSTINPKMFEVQGYPKLFDFNP